MNAIILLLLMPPLVIVSLYFMCGWLPEFLGPDPAPALVWMAGLCGVVGPVILNWLYYAGFESSRFAATPGKILLGLKVTDVNGQPFSFWSCSQKQAMTMALFGVPIFLNGAVSFICARANLKGMEIYLYVTASAVFLIPLIGYLMALFDKKHQTVYDKMVARIVSVDPPEAEGDGQSMPFFKRLPGKILLAIIPVMIVALSTSIGTLLHRPEVNPLIREAIETPEKWQQLGVSRVQRKVIVEQTVKAGHVITADDVSEVRVPSTDIGPDQVVCTDLVVGKKPIVTLKPGDFMSLRDLPYARAQEARQQIFAEAARSGTVGLCPHAKNRSTAKLDEFRVVKAVDKDELFRDDHFVLSKLIDKPTAVKMILPLAAIEGNTSKVNYEWEFAGKKCRNFCRVGQMLQRRNIAPSGRVYRSVDSIANNQIIEAKDLREEQIDPLACAYTMISAEKLIIGKRASKAIARGKIIRANDLLWK
ncbi:MAG: SAF domain-containing protein [Cyanobacteria bacterium REEB67]|nr:SAF domain-containing protein [Cyanobacteria bacterium REEB67]